MNAKLVLPLCLILGVARTTFPQGSLTPPGTPAPTMKTLDQIEPRKEVNATNTPGDGSNVFVISTSGSYYLAGNVTGVSGKNGIRITAPNVTLDLNGFELVGVPGSDAGVYTFVPGGRSLAIRNGTIRDWGGKGVESLFIVFGLFEDLRLDANGSHGLETSGGSVIRNCTASSNAGHGFRFSAVGGGGIDASDAVVENCFATGNGENGFDLTGAAITNCGARLNGGNGIDASEASTITNCLASANVGDGINAGPGSTLIHCTANANTANGMVAAEGSTLTNCTARGNTGTYGIFAGVGSTLTNCTAHENDAEFGIRANDRGTLTNCTSALNTSAAADSWGISAGAQCTISNCSVNGNLNTNGTPSDSTGGGILAGSSSNIQNCTVVGNKGDGIQIVSDSRVVGNNCDSSGFGGGNAAGIHSTGADNRIEGNNLTDNTRGIDVDSTGTLIIKNSASGNGINYEIAASNAVGVIVSAPASVAISGSTGGAGTGSTDPWANISY